MHLVRLALLSVALVVAGCASGSGASGAPTIAATPAGPSATAASTRIAVQLTDAMKIEPAQMSVPAGVPVTFVVTNTGVLDHEFFLGDEAAQAQHDQEMLAGGMTHDEPMGIGVKPGQTKELTVTFPAAGSILAGCHTPGHYAAGMKATVLIGT